MYAGSTLTVFSGRIMGAHQKIDRVARHHLEQLAPKSDFPKIRKILHFEGGNGPDAIKRKSPGHNEPWHYIQPFIDTDTGLLDIIDEHYRLLVAALLAEDGVRAAFESAWMAHAIVDGLTPAHHYPYEEKLVELRNGESLATRVSVKDKIIQPGKTRRGQVSNNWKMWGPKGLFVTHTAFEWGFATLIAPLNLQKALPSIAETEQFNELGPRNWFLQTAQDIVGHGYYDRFHEEGWTFELAREIRQELAPAIVRAVTLAWYGALHEAEITKKAGK